MPPVHRHDHDHHHASGEHGHHHHHAPASGHDRAFAIGIGLNLAFVGVEAGYGFISHSLALLADAGHNLSDVAGLALAWMAAWAGRRAPSARRTYGLRRSSILAAALNAVLLLAAVGVIGYEAVERLQAPQPVATGIMIWVAAAGIAVNGATAAMFLRGRAQDLNIRAAFLHMAGDAAVSAGVVLAALAIARTGWLWLDPAVSLGIAAVIAIGAWRTFLESMDLSLDAVPPHIDPGAVAQFLSAQPGVTQVHDLHIWAMSTTEVALTAHMVRPQGGDDQFLAQLGEDLHHRFAVDHATIQVETGAPGCLCRLAEPGSL